MSDKWISVKDGKPMLGFLPDSGSLPCLVSDGEYWCEGSMTAMGTWCYDESVIDEVLYFMEIYLPSPPSEVK